MRSYPVKIEDVEKEIRKNLQEHRKRCLESCNELTLDKFLKSTNFLEICSRYFSIENFINKEVSSRNSLSRQGMFGHFLQGVVIIMAGANSHFSSNPTHDVGAGDVLITNEITGISYLLELKSGENTCNGGGRKNMEAQFIKHKQTSNSNNKSRSKKNPLKCMIAIVSSNKLIIKINKPKYGFGVIGVDYVLGGQALWTFLTGNPNIYLDLMEITHEGTFEYEAALKEADEQTTKRLIDELNMRELNSWEKLLKFSCANMEKIMEKQPEIWEELTGEKYPTRNLSIHNSLKKNKIQSHLKEITNTEQPSIDDLQKMGFFD